MYTSLKINKTNIIFLGSQSIQTTNGLLLQQMGFDTRKNMLLGIFSELLEEYNEEFNHSAASVETIIELIMNAVVRRRREF
ncbi:MAG TPA: hypothetical protein VGA67_01990 [Candidatus Dojkabacteria bacterium]|jgi:hypothetical protein